jgi:hypothetical protein
MAELHAEPQHMFEMMATVREIKGVREDDRDALMAMFMEIVHDRRLHLKGKAYSAMKSPLDLRQPEKI